jgi:hypothetical protein
MRRMCSGYATPSGAEPGALGCASFLGGELDEVRGDQEAAFRDLPVQGELGEERAVAVQVDLRGGFGGAPLGVTGADQPDRSFRRTRSPDRSEATRMVISDEEPPALPPGKSHGDVNDAIAAVMRRVLDGHQDFKFIFKQGAEFGPQYEQLKRLRGGAIPQPSHASAPA